MLVDFLFDVLLLRQGRNVTETALNLHGLSEIKDPIIVISWDSFLKSIVQPGDYIFGFDARKSILSALDSQLQIIGRVKPAVAEDRFNCELSRRQEVVLSAAKKLVADEDAWLTSSSDRFLRLW